MTDPRAGRDGIRHRADCTQPEADSRAEGDAIIRRCPMCHRAAAYHGLFDQPRPVEDVGTEP